MTLSNSVASHSPSSNLNLLTTVAATETIASTDGALQESSLAEEPFALVDESANENPEIINPLIFQCKSCRSVLGDSFSWLSADQELNAITLTSRGSNTVRVEKDMQFSSTGVDAGSAYNIMLCVQCGASVGKSYRATPRKWDHLRDVFTFDLNMITSYQLGVDSVGSAEGAMEEMVTMPSAFELRSQIAKLQTTIIRLGERLFQMESLLQQQQQRLGPSKPSKRSDL